MSKITKKNISVLGCGRWGSFLAWYVNKLGHNVINYGIDDEIYRDLASTRKNEFVTLDDKIELTNDLEKAIKHAEIIIVSISSQWLRSFFADIVKHDIKNKSFVLCMKGIEESTGERLTEVVIESGVNKNQIAVWLGPGHIQDFVAGIPNCMMIDSYNPELTKSLVDIFRSDLIRFYYGDDIIGTEVGAATKNIFGIVAGILDGLNYTALKGALMARGAREVSRLIKAMGGNELSAYGLCHLGDYEATLFSKYSNNRAWGESFAKNQRYCKLAEGVATAKAVGKLAEKYGVEMPITNALNETMTNKLSPNEAIKQFFIRDMTNEFY